MLSISTRFDPHAPTGRPAVWLRANATSRTLIGSDVPLRLRATSRPSAPMLWATQSSRSARSPTLARAPVRLGGSRASVPAPGDKVIYLSEVGFPKASESEKIKVSHFALDTVRTRYVMDQLREYCSQFTKKDSILTMFSHGVYWIISSGTRASNSASAFSTSTTPATVSIATSSSLSSASATT
jgi:hypothetical protein